MWFKIEICPIVRTDGCRKQGEVVKSLLAWKESLLSQYPLKSSTHGILILSYKAREGCEKQVVYHGKKKWLWVSDARPLTLFAVEKIALHPCPPLSLSTVWVTHALVLLQPACSSPSPLQQCLLLK